jgi:hypothetical protein
VLSKWWCEFGVSWPSDEREAQTDHDEQQSNQKKGCNGSFCTWCRHKEVAFHAVPCYDRVSAYNVARCCCVVVDASSVNLAVALAEDVESSRHFS